MSQEPLTQLLKDWREGDNQALNKLTPIVYEELKKQAISAFRGERPNHTLQPTALVNEAYVKLVGADINWQNRTHFFALSARMMRRILVNHANARRAKKRGSGQTADTYIEEHHKTDSEHDQVLLLTLNDQLNKLAKFDKRSADAIELYYFAGLTRKEMSDILQVSMSTLERDLKFAKAWLRKNMADINI